MTITVDTREDVKFFNFLCDAFPDAHFIRAPLPEGDYQSEKAICERKRIADLAASIYQNKRWESQIERLSVHEDKVRILLVTGSMKEFEKTTEKIGVFINTDVLYGAASSVCCRFGFQLLWFEDEGEGLIVMTKLMHKIDEGKYMVPPRHDPNILIARLLGVTQAQWFAMRHRFGPLSLVAKCTSEQLQTMYGIGPAKAKKILDTLNKM